MGLFFCTFLLLTLTCKYIGQLNNWVRSQIILLKQLCSDNNSEVLHGNLCNVERNQTLTSAELGSSFCSYLCRHLHCLYFQSSLWRHKAGPAQGPHGLTWEMSWMTARQLWQKSSRTIRILLLQKRGALEMGRKLQRRHYGKAVRRACLYFDNIENGQMK